MSKTSGASKGSLLNLVLFSAPPEGSNPKMGVSYSLPSYFPFVCFSEQYFGNLQSVQVNLKMTLVRIFFSIILNRRIGPSV